MIRPSAPFVTAALLLALVLPAVSSAQPQSEPQSRPEPPPAIDVEAAQALAKRNDCFKCHAIDKTKKGPAFRRVAARLRAKPDGVEVIIEHITSGHLVQLQDGTEEKHRIIDTRQPNELRNLALWILSL